MVTVKDLTELTLKDLWREVKGEEDWWGDIAEDTRQMIKRLLESTMEEEIIAQLQVTKYQRSRLRQGYRNGHRRRSVLTHYGLLDGIQVPRDRLGEYRPRVLDRYQRRQREVNRMVREMFLSGVSTRKVKSVLRPMLGVDISPQTVSRIVKELDDEVRHFHLRRIEEGYQYLLLDGITMKVKSVAGVKKRLVLCAYGITSQGKRELISFRQGTAESEAQWEAFLRNLYERGLEGKDLKLITTDGCAGLHRALATVYGYIPRQRCWAHKLRNVASKLRRRNQEACLKQVKKVYLAETRREATSLFREWARQWRNVEPKAMKCLEVDMDEMLPFLDCPKRHWVKVRTTNAIERAFREVRRRTRPMSCFQNSASVDRIIYGVISHLNADWEEKPLPQFTHNT